MCENNLKNLIAVFDHNLGELGVRSPHWFQRKFRKRVSTRDIYGIQVQEEADMNGNTLIKTKGLQRFGLVNMEMVDIDWELSSSMEKIMEKIIRVCIKHGQTPDVASVFSLAPGMSVTWLPAHIVQLHNIINIPNKKELEEVLMGILFYPEENDDGNGGGGIVLDKINMSLNSIMGLASKLQELGGKKKAQLKLNHDLYYEPEIVTSRRLRSSNETISVFKEAFLKHGGEKVRI